MQCDASIKAIIMVINSERHDYVIEELDEETVIVHDNKLAELKERLNHKLRDTQMDVDDSGSD